MDDFVLGYIKDGDEIILGEEPEKAEKRRVKMPKYKKREHAAQEEISKVFHEFVSMIEPCGRCAHKVVCNLAEKGMKECSHFLYDCNPKVYGNIHTMIQPIFDWMKIHYPSREVRLIVESDTAQLWQEHKLSIYSKELTGIANYTMGKDTDRQDSKKV